MFNDIYYLIIYLIYPKVAKQIISSLCQNWGLKSSDSSNFVIDFDLSSCSVSKLWIPLLLVIQPFLSSGRKQRCRGVIWPQKGTGDQNIIGACPKFQTRHCLVWGLSELLNSMTTIVEHSLAQSSKGSIQEWRGHCDKNVLGTNYISQLISKFGNIPIPILWLDLICLPRSAQNLFLRTEVRG